MFIYLFIASRIPPGRAIRKGNKETGELGNRETGKLGNRETGKPGNRETGKLGNRYGQYILRNVWQGTVLDLCGSGWGQSWIQNRSEMGPERVPNGSQDSRPPWGTFGPPNSGQVWGKQKHAQNVSHSSNLGKPPILQGTCSKKSRPSPSPPWTPGGSRGSLHFLLHVKHNMAMFQK